MLLPVVTGSAQEALQNMQAGYTAADSRSQQMQSPQGQDYTFKSGDFRLLLTPSLGFQYNDNVNLANTNALNDFIVSPMLGITASYPITERNLIYLDVTVGYDRYLKNSQFSTFELDSSSGTGLSLDFAIKDLTFNLHDWVNYTQGSGQNGLGANGVNSANSAVANTATFGTFQNTAGLSGTWDLNQVTLSAGYDHQNILSTSGEFDDTSHSAEMFFVRGGAHVYPKATVGLESTAALTTYDQNALNNSDAYTVGPYLEYRPGAFFTVTMRGGYSTYLFQNTSTTIQTSSQNGWYAGISIAHQPTDAIKYSLDIGREVQLGVVSDLQEDWYVRPTVTWTFIKGLSIGTFFSYEQGNLGIGSTGSLPGYANGNFDWYGGGLGFQYAITDGLVLGLDYRITLHSSGTAYDTYTQNSVALQLTYHPK